jgi:hypothetical protein
MIQTLFSRSVLALALLSGAGVASAATAPQTSYHVEINTAGFAGQGWLDFSFIPGHSPATGANATVSHFSGLFGNDAETSGMVSGSLAQGINFGNTAPYNDYLRAITLGGKFGFDVQFSGDFLTMRGISGTQFSTSLLGLDYANLGNPRGPLVTVDLNPLQPHGPATVHTGVFDPHLATISPVPEPSSWLMLLAGAGFIGLRRIARQRSEPFA